MSPLSNRNRTIIQFISTFMLFVFVLISITEIINKTIINLQGVSYPFALSEWLINYSAGFVRRGLAGEILLSTKHEHLIAVMNFAILIIYLANLSLIIYFAKKTFKSSTLTLLLILIPGGFVQMAIVGDPLDSFARKEMLFYLFVTYCAIRTYRNLEQLDNPPLLTNPKNRNSLVFISEIFLFSILGMLIHEAFIFFSMSSLLLLLWVNIRIFNQKKVIMLAYLALMATLLVIVTVFHGSPEIAEDMIRSLPEKFKQSEAYEVDSIRSIGWTLDHQLGLNWDGMRERSIILGLQAVPLLLCYFFGLSFLLGRGLSVSNRSLDPLICGCLVFAYVGTTTVPLFLIGVDWNRWLASVGIHSVILLFLFSRLSSTQLAELSGFSPENRIVSSLTNLKPLNKVAYQNKYARVIVLVGVLWIGTTFDVGDCCEIYLRMGGTFAFQDALFAFPDTIRRLILAIGSW